jgi:hypothetical protein
MIWRYIIVLMCSAYVRIHIDVVAGNSNAPYRYSCRENKDNDEITITKIRI